MLNVFPSLLVLGLAALSAALMVQRRSSPPERAAERRSAARVLAFAVGLQSLHFLEEVSTGFHHRLGALLDIRSIPLSLFVSFNLLWLGIWIASVPGLRSARSGAFFAAWFLAIAGVVNGILHPVLAFLAGGYFPGVVTSPAIGIAGAWLFLQLHKATRPTEDS